MRGERQSVAIRSEAFGPSSLHPLSAPGASGHHTQSREPPSTLNCLEERDFMA